MIKGHRFDPRSSTFSLERREVAKYTQATENLNFSRSDDVYLTSLLWDHLLHLFLLLSLVIRLPASLAQKVSSTKNMKLLSFACF